MAGAKQIFGADELGLVANYLQAGGVLAYPSESVWGLGCDAFNTDAINQIINLKHRDIGKGLIVLTDAAERLKSLIDVSHETSLLDYMQTFSDEFTQQHSRALTWLVPIKPSALPSALIGAYDTLAVRITTHPLLKDLCQALISPANPYGFLVSTSCNPSGQAPAQNLAQAMEYFGDQIAYLDTDGLGFVQPSCIKDLLTGDILR